MTAIQERQVLREALGVIRARLPKDWSAKAAKPTLALADRAVDALLVLRSPSGEQAPLRAQVRTRAYPSSVAAVADQATQSETMLIAAFLSPAVRRQLTARGMSFADLTGNVRIVMSKPGLFVETTGATSDPSPRRPKRSLKGAQASRVIRALVDARPPFRLTDIAARTLVDVGHVSRLLKQLEQEGLLTRRPRGEVTDVNWEELIRRWAQEYQVTKSNAPTYMFEARGLPSLLTGLRATRLRYALTGSIAASMRAAVAPAALAMLYVDDRGAVANELKLRPAASGGNVVLLVPKDSLPFEGATRMQDLVVAAPSQVAADLLTGPGRSSSEAEAFLDWMKDNEDAWRR
jgi:hypothetical protein